MTSIATIKCPCRWQQKTRLAEMCSRDQRRTANRHGLLGICWLAQRVGQNAQGVLEGVDKGVSRASFGRQAPVTPQPNRA